MEPNTNKTKVTIGDGTDINTILRQTDDKINEAIAAFKQ